MPENQYPDIELKATFQVTLTLSQLIELRNMKKFIHAIRSIKSCPMDGQGGKIVFRDGEIDNMAFAIDNMEWVDGALTQAGHQAKVLSTDLLPLEDDDE